MTEYESLSHAAKEIEMGFLGSFLAPSLSNDGQDWTVERHDIYQNDEQGLVVFRRYSNKALNLTEYR